MGISLYVRSVDHRGQPSQGRENFRFTSLRLFEEWQDQRSWRRRLALPAQADLAPLGRDLISGFPKFAQEMSHNVTS
jgi:hypothetical protein